MKCYVHRKKDAIGICSVCYRGVCEKCIAQDDPIICKSCYEKIKKGEVQPTKPKQVETVVRPIGPVSQTKKVGSKVSKTGGVLSVWERLKSDHPLPIDNRVSFDMLTPVALFGMITGLLMGIPLLSLLFFVLIPLSVMLSIMYLRVEHDYKVWVGERKGMITGALIGLVVVLVSMIVFIATSAYLGSHVYPALRTLFGSSWLGDVIITLASGNNVLNGYVIKLRLITTLVLYTLLGVISGYYFARKIR